MFLIVKVDFGRHLSLKLGLKSGLVLLNPLEHLAYAKRTRAFDNSKDAELNRTPVSSFIILTTLCSPDHFRNAKRANHLGSHFVA